MKTHVSRIALICIFVFPCFLFGCNTSSDKAALVPEIKMLDLSRFSEKPPPRKIDLLFIHHSCGATLLADPGEKQGKYCLWPSHPYGGGLRKLLERNNYNVHEATYGSKIGQDTDINHWHKKFRDHMDAILKTDLQDKQYEDERVNQIVVFKSCYPNNMIVAEGTPPGDPDSPKRTLWNCKAAYNSLLPIFRKYPNTLFVAMTAPPIVKPKVGRLKSLLMKFRGKNPEQIGKRARVFNDWLRDRDSGWLSEYELKNVVVFPFYHILTGEGTSNFTKYPTQKGRDSHPSAEGSRIAAKEFVSFLNRAVRYANLAL